MDTAVLALVLQIPTPLDREHPPRVSAERPILMLGIRRRLGTRLALRTRMRMGAKPLRGMHRHRHPIHM